MNVCMTNAVNQKAQVVDNHTYSTMPKFYDEIKNIGAKFLIILYLTPIFRPLKYAFVIHLFTVCYRDLPNSYDVCMTDLSK